MAVSKKRRVEVLIRDFEKPCALCGDREGPFEVDHRDPVSNGGSDDLENLQKLCRICNGGKSNLILDPETESLTKPVYTQTTDEAARSKLGAQAKIIQALIDSEPIAFQPESRGYGDNQKFFITATGGATDTELIRDHGISKFGLDEALRTLRTTGWLERHGSTRGRWYIIFDFRRDGWPQHETPEGFEELADFRDHVRDIGVVSADEDTRFWDRDWRVLRRNPSFYEHIVTGETKPNRNIRSWVRHPTSVDYEWFPADGSVRLRRIEAGGLWLDHPDDLRCEYHPATGLVRYKAFQDGDVLQDPAGRQWQCERQGLVCKSGYGQRYEQGSIVGYLRSPKGTSPHDRFFYDEKVCCPMEAYSQGWQLISRKIKT